MKTSFLSTCALAALAAISGNFMVRDKEDLNFRNSECINPNDKCFDSFLSNLKTLDALIFIPDNKINEAKLLGLTPMDKEVALKSNLKLVSAVDMFLQIVPFDTISDCKDENLLNFKKLNMVVFVKKDKQTSLKAMNLVKLDNTLSLVKLTTFNKVVKIEGTTTEKLKIKFDNNKEVNYTPFFKVE